MVLNLQGGRRYYTTTATADGLVPAGAITEPGGTNTSFNAPNDGAILTSKTGSYITYNAYVANGQWLRYDTAATATLLLISAAGVIYNYTAPAGANPISWTGSTLAAGPDSGWIALGGFAANWSSYVATNDFRAEYRKLASGLVLLRGLVKKSVALAYPDVISTGIPAGYRPGVVSARQQIFNQANAAHNTTDLRVDWNGGITLLAGGSNLWVSLDGISYLAEA